MSAAEWHRWLVRLAVEAGADIEQAHERMSQAACAIAVEYGLSAGDPEPCCVRDGVYCPCAEHAAEMDEQEARARFDEGAEMARCCAGGMR